MIEIAMLSSLVVVLLYLAIASDDNQQRVKSLSINGVGIDHWNILVPARWINKRTGLLNAINVPIGEGLLIATSRVHTKGMLCSIDLVALDKNGRVMTILEQVRPNTKTIRMPRTTHFVLEIASGASRQLQLKKNDLINFGDRT